MCICGKNEMIASILEISFSSRAMDRSPRTRLRAEGEVSLEPERQVLDGPKPGHGSTGEGQVTGGHPAARFCPQPRRNQGHLTRALCHSCPLPLGFPGELPTGAQHPDGKHAP